ncbi:unnamed protein product [Paramecium pentaurelia]|uniref:Transmembrane protein n=1 Tax=Paramecium pentaurelia TaxID=43138 RepID=A0A8S1WMC8_9CILI|nr:unnamed protein product [Paramecium pentaurelia]
MNISILIFFLSQLKEILTFSIIDLNQQYQIQRDDFDLSFQDFGVNKLLTYGMWSKYNPLSIISKVGPVGQMESDCFLIHYTTSILTQNLNLIYYDCLDYTERKILKTIEFVDEENNQHKIELQIDNNKYEDVWHFCQFIIYPNQRKFEVIILNQEDTLLHQFFELKFPFKDQNLSLIFGSSLIVNKSYIFSILKGRKFATFPGFLKVNKILIQESSIYQNFEVIAFKVLQGFIQCQCIQDSTFKLKDWDLSSVNKLTYLSQNTNCDSFQFQGWLRINNIGQLPSDITYQIIKISSNFNSAILSNQNLSPFQYIYQLSPTMHRIIITTYSYNFPLVNIDFTDNPFLIFDQFDVLNKVQLWHKLIVNLQKNELQLSISFYDESEIYTISRLINVVQFHSNQFRVNYGNLLNNINNAINIQVRNFLFFNCQQPINELNCHQSCFECNGPTKLNCLSCSQESNRIYLIDKKMCVCPYGLIDTGEKCESYSDLGFQLIKDASIFKDKSCLYGYFLIGDECIQCPSIINSQRLTCIECLMNPQKWINSLVCQQDISINKIGETAYYFQDFDLQYFYDGFDFYFCLQNVCDVEQIFDMLTIQQDEIFLRSFGDQNEFFYGRFECSDNCFDCLSNDVGLLCKECDDNFKLADGKCQDIYCYPPYYMNMAGRCKKCPIQNCKYCFEYQNNDLSKCTLYHDFQSFNTDEIINVGCALCNDDYTFDFSQSICIQKKMTIQNCLRSYVNLENQEICTLASIQDFSIAPEIINCQELVENCMQCIQTPEFILKCIICTTGYVPSLENGSCQKTTFEVSNFKISVFSQEFYYNGWIQLIQSFLMSFLPNQYIYPYNFNRYYKIQILECKEGWTISSLSYLCIKDCSSECLSCYQQNFESLCRICPLNEFQQPIINQYQGKCYECPQFCKICQPSSEDKINSNQPQFIINDNLFYTRQCIMPQQIPNVQIDPQLQIAKYCFDNDCNSILSFETIIEDCNFINLADATTFYKNQIDFYNQMGQDKLILKYIFDFTDICKAQRGLYLNNQLKQQIYSLQFIKMVAVAVKDSLLFSFGTIIFSNFDSVELQNFRLKIFKSNLHFQNNQKAVELSLINILIQDEEQNNLEALFKATLFSQINFQNVSFLDTNISNSSILNFETMKLNGFLKINELQFTNCIITNSKLFKFFDHNFTILIENLIIQKCEFYNSFIFAINSNERMKSKFTFHNLIIQNSKFYNSTFFYNSLSMDLIISKVQLNQNIFDQSVVFSSDQQIYMQSIIMEQNTYLYSHFLQSIPYSEIIVQITNIQIFYNNLQYSTLFDIRQNQHINKCQVKLYDFNLSNNIDQSIFNKNLALFEITCFSLIIKNFEIINTKNVRIFYLQETDIIQIDNLIYKTSDDQTRIPIFLECQEQIQYNNQLLLIINFLEIKLQNLQLAKQSSIDLSLIQIISNVQIFNQQNASVQIKNVEFFGNVQLQQKETSYQSQLMIFSELKILIILENLQFTENMFHSQTQEIQYASCLLCIVSKASKVEILKLTSRNNAITNSSHTFISITSNSLVIRNMDIQNHNFLNSIIWQQYYKLNLNSVYNQDQINQIIMQTIQILNVGGVAKIETQNFSCFNSTFRNIIALKSLIFDITLQGNSFCILHEIILTTIENNLQSQREGSGCISILSLNGQLNIDIQRIKFQNVLTRISTSIFTIAPSIFRTSILIKDILIQNCYSLINSIFNLQFKSQKTNYDLIILKDLQIIQQEEDLLNYLQKIGPLTVEEISKITSTENALIYLSDCQVEIKGIYIQGVYLYPIMKFKNVHKLLLSNCFMYEIQQVSTQNLITFTQTRNQNLFVQLQQLSISKVNTYNLTTTKFKYNLMINYFIRDCENIQKKEVENSPTQYIESYLQQIKQQSSDSKSLIYFQSTSNESNFNFQSINLFKNECFGCEKGLFYFEISNFKMINFIDLNCNQNTVTELGCVSFQQEQFHFNRILIKNSNFISNKGGKGIAIFALNVTLTILECKIISNQAQKQGGGLFIDQSSFLVKKTILLSNSAQEGGGIFLNGNLNLNNDNFVRSFLFFNWAEQQSNNIFESPTHLSLSINSVEQLSLSLDDTNAQQRILKLKPYKTIEQGKVCEKNYLMIPSNQQINKFKLIIPQQNRIFFYIKEFSLYFKNSRNELILGLVNSSCIINSYLQQLNSNISIQYLENISISYNTQKDNFDLSQLLFIFDPYLQGEKYLTIQFTCFAQQSNNKLHYLINARSFMCQLGEFYSEQGCQECQSSQGFYSVTYNATKCSIFDKTKFSKITSNSISLLKGFWRPHILSDYIDECFKTLNVCIGGSGVGDQLCAQGHTGGLCEECDNYDLRGNGQYFKNQQNLECLPCNKLKDNIIALIITSIWALLSILLTLRSIDKSNKLFSSLNLTKRHSKIIFRLDQDFTSILMKMFLNNLWVFSIIFTFNLKFSFSFNIVDQTSNASYSISNNLDCFLSQIQQIQLIYSRIFAIIILILIQLFLVLLGYKITSLILHRKFNQSIITNTLLYLYVCNYGGLIKMLCSVISRRIISNIEFISGDVTLYFGSDNHNQWMNQFIIPLLILLGFTIPFSLFILLYTQRKKLHTTTFRKHICYLFNEYDNNAYYWEVIKLSLKSIIIVIATYFEANIFLKAALIGLCLLIYQILAVKNKPFILSNLNSLDLQAGQTCSIAIFIVVAKYVADQENEKFSSVFLQIIITLLLIRLCLPFIELIIKAYMKKYKTVLIQLIYQLFKFIAQNWSITIWLQRKLQCENQKKIKLMTNMKKIRQSLLQKQKTQYLQFSSIQSPYHSQLRSEQLKG